MLTSLILLLPFNFAALMLLRFAARAASAPDTTRLVRRGACNAAAAGLAAVVAGLAALVRWFGAVAGESVDPSQSARLLAPGSAEPPTVALVVAALGLFIPIGVAARLFLDKRRRPPS
jgi:hypothetical protein